MPPPECLYHATPLHYLPHILRDGALYAQSVLASRGIAPRATAKRRDRMLGLADYVHLSLNPDTPLLADKIAKGYPHAVLVFERGGVLALPQIALLPYNTKAWHTRSAYIPVEDRAEQAALLRRHEKGHNPSLEVLVKYGLDLSCLHRVIFLADAERERMGDLMCRLGLPASVPLLTDRTCFPGWETYQPVTQEDIFAYFETCVETGELLPPPELPFD